ncbi:MAG: hypothetical protein IPM97_01610 [Bdellovibrionaceae bacterium]|nr:hypothetical protein [Pseudobdellovibrionaceae bacterium]
MEQRKINLPKNGAGRRLAERLKKLGQQKPPKSLMDKINNDSSSPVVVSQNETKVRFKIATLYVAIYKWIYLQKTTFSGTF